MPLEFVTGSIFERDTQLLVCPVNTYGVAGAGLALEFKKRYPSQVDQYRKICRAGMLRPGQIFVNPETMNDDTIIVFAATKEDWKENSKSQWISDCLEGINIFLIDHQNIKTASIPALGCGLGRLSWKHIKQKMPMHLEGCLRSNPGLTILAFEPVKAT